MKVCIVSHSADSAGAELVLLETVEALRESGIDCLVIFPWDGPLVEAARERGAECTIIGYCWWIGAVGVKDALHRTLLNFPASLKLARYLVRHPCDVVVTNTIAVPVGGLAATLARVPHVWWMHEFGEEDHGMKFALGTRLSTWFMERTSSLLLANSLAVASKFGRLIRQSKIHVLYYSVHLNSADALGSPAASTGTGSRRVCIVGRIAESKGQADAIRALAEMRRRGTDATLLLVGPVGEYAAKMKGLCRQLGVQDRVEFTGQVENPMPLVASCDVAVVCSRCEAFGRVTVEAMKLGKPVVGARTGGTVELIQDGVNGFLHAPGDHEELASKLEILLGDAELRNRMGEAARVWACQQFTETKFRGDLVRLLSLALQGSRQRTSEAPIGAVIPPAGVAAQRERR